MNVEVRPSLKRDVVAGLTVAVSCVPQAIACGTLVGVNPMYGLYATVTGAIGGGLLTATPLLVITTTNATALTAGQGLSALSEVDRGQALFSLVVLTGLIQVAAGLLRAGRLTRFVAHAVMTGFLAGVSVIIVLSQLSQFVGYGAQGTNKLVQTLDLLLHIGSIDVASLLVGVLALALAVLLPRTRLGPLGTVVALAVPSVLVWLADLPSVATISSRLVTDVSPTIPRPSTDWFLSPDVISTAIAVAVVTLVQGVGVAKSVASPPVETGATSRDFLAQGVANLAAGAVNGLPVGASMGQSMLNVASGAQTRLASVLCGIWLALMLFAFSGLVGQVALPTVAAILIVVGFRSFPRHDMIAVWHSDRASRATLAVTFLATLVLPIQWAVALGVVLTGLLTLFQGSTDVVVVELRALDGGRFREKPAPSRLADRTVTVLDIHGSLFSASAWTLERLLPKPGDRAVAVLRLRGRSRLDATCIRVISTYGRRLAASGGALYLAGVGPDVCQQLQRTVSQGEPEYQVVAAAPVVFESVERAMRVGSAWLERDADLAAPHEHLRATGDAQLADQVVHV
ncbi:MAG TPA: SulP family inorganic anion transporter [Chloroflexota bacterium]